MERILKNLINKKCSICIKGWWYTGILQKNEDFYELKTNDKKILFVPEDITKPVEVGK